MKKRKKKKKNQTQEALPLATKHETLLHLVENPVTRPVHHLKLQHQRSPPEVALRRIKNLQIKESQRTLRLSHKKRWTRKTLTLKKLNRCSNTSTQRRTNRK